MLVQQLNVNSFYNTLKGLGDISATGKTTGGNGGQALRYPPIPVMPLVYSYNPILLPELPVRASECPHLTGVGGQRLLVQPLTTHPQHQVLEVPNVASGSIREERRVRENKEVKKYE